MFVCLKTASICCVSDHYFVKFSIPNVSSYSVMRSLLDHMFSYGDRLEVEIRGCTLWAIEVS